jgi:hypothetical protein
MPSPPGYDSAKAKEWVKEKVAEYGAMIISGDDMWEFAKDNMEEEIMENRLCLTDTALKSDLIALRKILRQKGVNIRKRQGVPVYKTFEDWLALPEFEWQADDLISLVKEFGASQLPYFITHMAKEFSEQAKQAKAANTETPSDASEPPRPSTATAATSNTPINNDNAATPINTTAIIGDTGIVAGGVALTFLPQQFDTISNVINEDMKYSGTNDALNHKISVFKTLVK